MGTKSVKSVSIAAYGMKITVLNVGAALKTWSIKSPNGNYYEMLASYDDLEEYTDNPIYLNSVVGPLAGRYGKNFLKPDYYASIDEKADEDFILHSGPTGISNLEWELNAGKDYIECTLAYPDVKNPFGSAVSFTVLYYLCEEGLRIKHSAYSLVGSPCNMCSHLYFSLPTNEKELALIDEYSLKFAASKMLETRDDLFPTKLVPILKDYDFIKGKSLAGVSLDTCFMLDSNIELSSDLIEISIESDYPAAVIYTPNGAFSNLPARFGIAIEMQHPPNLGYINLKYDNTGNNRDEDKNLYSFESFYSYRWKD